MCIRDRDNLKARVSQRMADTSYDVDKAVRFITVYQSGTKIPKLVNVIVK